MSKLTRQKKNKIHLKFHQLYRSIQSMFNMKFFAVILIVVFLAVPSTALAQEIVVEENDPNVLAEYVVPTINAMLALVIAFVAFLFGNDIRQATRDRRFQRFYDLARTAAIAVAAEEGFDTPQKRRQEIDRRVRAFVRGLAPELNSVLINMPQDSYADYIATIEAEVSRFELIAAEIEIEEE